MNETEYNQIMNDAYQSAQMAHQQADPNSLYADAMREEKVKNIIGQIDPDKLVEDIEHRIRGEKKDSFTGEWVKINTKNPKQISDKLVENYISFLSSILNQNTTFSNFSTGEINNLMWMISEHIRDDLSDNARDYGFEEVEYVKQYQIIKRKELVKQKINGVIITKYDWVPYRVIREVPIVKKINFHEMTRIGIIICNTTWAVLKRAQNGMEARRIFNNWKINESINPPKKGVMDVLNFMK